MAKNSPILLVLMGSFNPPHYAHLRILEMAKDHLEKLSMKVIGGVMTPVHDAYGKKSLIPYQHRRAMVERATRGTGWISCSEWEGNQKEWTPTVKVLEAIQSEARTKYGEPNVITKVACGADLLETFSVPGLWKDEDLEKILGNHGVIVSRRPGSDPDQFIFRHELCYNYKHNISIVYEPVANDVSSTVLRTLASRNRSIRFFTPDPVCEYIKENKLYTSHNQ